MWQGIQEHCIGQLPCRKEWTRSIRGIYGGGTANVLLCHIFRRLINPVQIKPLTEEEKQQKLAELREKMAEKRAKKSIEEAKEAKANEALRRKAGKVSKLHSCQYFITHRS